MGWSADLPGPDAPPPIKGTSEGCEGYRNFPPFAPSRESYRPPERMITRTHTPPRKDERTMPPPRTIHVDRKHILATIRQIAAEQRAAVLAEPEIWNGQHEHELPATTWVPRDLELLSGK